MTLKLQKIILPALVMTVFASEAAVAHPGHESFYGFQTGFLHPVLGLDHLLAMALVGIWGGMLGGRSKYLLPLSFVASMAMGAVFAFAGYHIPMMEGMILLSLVVFGVFIAMDMRFITGIGMALVSIFALAHGFAHGLEMPPALGPWTYGAGFVFASALLHVAGLVFGKIGAAMNLYFIRVFGGLIAAFGAYSLTL